MRTSIKHMVQILYPCIDKLELVITKVTFKSTGVLDWHNNLSGRFSTAEEI